MGMTLHLEGGKTIDFDELVAEGIRLKAANAELLAACKYAVADMSDFGRVQRKTWDMMTAAIRKGGD